MKLVVAPNFHLEVVWAERVRIGPEGRSASEAELAALVGVPQVVQRSQLGECVCLFALPGHLRAKAWRVLAEGGFEEFAQEVSAFLAFKQCPLPSETSFELIASPPGLVESYPETERRVMAGVNLSEEDADVVFWREEMRVVFRLKPGEGWRWDRGGKVTGSTLGKSEPELMLLMRQAEPRS